MKTRSGMQRNLLYAMTSENTDTFGQKFRSSHQRCSVKNDILKNFPNFTGRRLC